MMSPWKIVLLGLIIFAVVSVFVWGTPVHELLFFYFVGQFAVWVIRIGLLKIADPALSWTQALSKFFFARTAENGISWATTFGVVWMFGAWYSGAFSLLGVASVDLLPIHSSVALTLGTLMEGIAPKIAEILTTKVLAAFGGK